MEIRQIQHFLQLFNDRNITRASRNLYISQQGLSKSITKLEGELGFPLFERSYSGVEPTERAIAMYPHFEKVTLAYRDLMLAVEDIHENKRLSIAAPTGFALSRDRDFLAEYRNSHPDVTLSYEELPEDQIHSMLVAGKIDLAYIYGPVADDLISYCEIDSEPLMAIMDSSHPLAQKKNIHLNDLKNSHILLLDSLSPFNDELARVVSENHIPVEYASFSGLTEYLPQIQSSTNIGFAPASFFRYYNFPQISFCPLKLEKVKVTSIHAHLVSLSGVVPGSEATEYIRRYLPDFGIESSVDEEENSN